MSDMDLIRRIDAMQACQVGPSDEWSAATKSGYNQAATDCAMNILRVPAAPEPPEVTAMVDAADHLLRNYLQDELDDPELCWGAEHWASIRDLEVALAHFQETTK